ncbi:C39 family peptidase [Jeongeupia wiesaeckerbachi]|uniref:C39 family peptidase n=1 Tax=Jeongeupia wiesaeckerbachi TaxID=3051218 RepID=UPI003D8074FC
MRYVGRMIAAGVLGSIAMAAGAAPMEVVAGPFDSFSVNVTTFKERAFINTVRQKYDFSCGSAALATLLHYHYGVPTDETQVFKGMYEHGNQDLIQKYGFSMADMKAYLEAKGFEANGFKMSLSDLASVGVPAIVVLDLGGYRHFVVIKGISDEWVLVGDPAVGVKSYTRPAFERMWGQIAFLILDSKSVGQKGFNTVADWSAVTKGPAASGVFAPNLANFSLHLPGPNDFRF